MKKKMKTLLTFTFLGSLICLNSCGGNNDNSQVTPKENYYKVTWKNYDGNVLEVDEKVKEGTIPEYNGSTPLKEGNDKYSYTFNGWSPEIKAVSEDATYVATFNETINQYTIDFETFGGSGVPSITKDYGTLVEEPIEEPVLEGKTFIGWCIDEDLTTPVSWPFELKEDVTLYASYNTKVDIGEYLKALLNGYKVNPKSYIPETLLPEYEKNLINKGDLDFDYSNFVDTSKILDYGYGEQWMMVVDNLNQSMMFFNTLSVVDTIASASITTFNNYLDKNPGTTASYEFQLGEYKVFISYDGNIMEYMLEFNTTIPVYGDIEAQIVLELNTKTGERIGRIQLDEANALKYTLSENSYTFAIRYGGVRRAYFNITKEENGAINGSIYEYLGVDDVYSYQSAANFYINGNYATVVGNKAGGLMGFTGTICELYNTINGHLLGYEVNEQATILGVEVNYDTLWINLSDTKGIDSIKLIKNEEEASLNPYYVYLNNSSSIFETKKYGGISSKTASRRYDIELRDRYFTYYDENEDSYVTNGYKIPMLFVQEEKYDDLVNDINNMNDSLNFSLSLSRTYLDKLINDYHSYLEVFNENKENITIDYILSYIGNKK